MLRRIIQATYLHRKKPWASTNDNSHVYTVLLGCIFISIHLPATKGILHIEKRQNNRIGIDNYRMGSEIISLSSCKYTVPIITRLDRSQKSNHANELEEEKIDEWWPWLSLSVNRSSTVYAFFLISSNVPSKIVLFDHFNFYIECTLRPFVFMGFLLHGMCHS